MAVLVRCLPQHADNPPSLLCSHAYLLLTIWFDVAAMSRECVVVIDGANVSRQKDGKTTIAKLAAAIEYFRLGVAAASKLPIKCVAFVPNFWLNVKPTATGGSENGAMQTDDWELLKQLVEKDYVTLTPSQVIAALVEHSFMLAFS